MKTAAQLTKILSPAQAPAGKPFGIEDVKKAFDDWRNPDTELAGKKG